MNQQTIDQCVEHLCLKGCRAVWGDIRALEAGASLPETRGLTTAEIDAVLAELKSVMAVYKGSCELT